MTNCQGCGEDCWGAGKAIDCGGHSASFCPSCHSQYDKLLGTTHTIAVEKCQHCQHSKTEIRTYNATDKDAFKCCLCGNFVHIALKSNCLEPTCDSCVAEVKKEFEERLAEAAMLDPLKARAMVLEAMAYDAIGVQEYMGEDAVCECGLDFRHHHIQRFPSGRNIITFGCECGKEESVEVRNGPVARCDKVPKLTTFAGARA